MLTNRLVRALVGAVIAQASVAAAWYVYKKEQNLKDKQDEKSTTNEEKSSEDMNALENTSSDKVHDLTPALEQVEQYLQAKEDLKKEKAQKVIDALNFTVHEVTPEVTKPKRVRKPRAASKNVPNETTVAAIKEADQIVQEKKARRTTPVKKDMFVAPEAAAKPARKRTPAAKKAETVVEPTATKPARKRVAKKQA